MGDELIVSEKGKESASSTLNYLNDLISFFTERIIEFVSLVFEKDYLTCQQIVLFNIKIAF